MHPIGLTTGTLADDLTGACETALQFYLAGAHSRVVISDEALRYVEAPGEDGTNLAWTINTNSRHGQTGAPFNTRLIQTLDILKSRFGAEQFYKKMDSTLRGHFAQECEAILTGLHLDCVLIAPAYPEEGRQTVGGYQMVHSIPVERSVMNRDPLSPVSESHIPSILAHCIDPDLIGQIELKTVLDGAGPILSEMQNLLEAGKKYLIVDACSRTDLDQIALAWVKAQNSMSCLPCGSAGLAQSLCKYWIDSPDETDEPATDNIVSLHRKKEQFSPTPHVLMVVGSTTDTARSQLSYLMKQATLTQTPVHWVRPTPSDMLGLNPHNPVSQQLGTALSQPGITILTTNETEEQVTHTQTLGQEHQLSDSGIHSRIQEQLGQWVHQAILANSNLPLSLVAVGGETALSLCSALHIYQALIVDKVHTQVPIMHTRYQLSEQSHPTSIQLVTKSGDLGDTHLLWHVVQRIFQPSDASVDATDSVPTA